MSRRRNEARGKYEVRWTEGGRRRSKLFERAGDADAFEDDVKRRKALGPLAASVMESRMTLEEFVVDDWLPHYAEPNLRENTIRRYREVWLVHVKPRLGAYELRELTPQLLEDFLEQLARAKVGLETRRKAILLLSGILKRAAVRQLIPVNPVSLVTKPKGAVVELANPLAPITVERIRARLGRFDQVVLDLLAYCGLRPNEAIATDWRQVGERVIRVTASKTSTARAVNLMDPVVESLNEWRMACGRPTSGPILPRTSRWLTGQRRPVDHEHWTRWDWQNWSKRVYREAAAASGVTGDLRAYRLRCSFVSLLLWEGRSLVYVSQQAGHSIATLSKHYAGVIQELEDQPRVTASVAIREARDAVVIEGRRSPLSSPGRQSGW